MYKIACTYAQASMIRNGLALMINACDAFPGFIQYFHKAEIQALYAKINDGLRVLGPPGGEIAAKEEKDLTP